MTAKVFEATMLAALASMGVILGGEPADPPPLVEVAEDPAEAKVVDDLLSRWEEHAAALRTIDAEFTREDVSKTFDLKKSCRGWYWAKGDDRARVSFSEVGADGVARPREELLLANGQLHRSNHVTRKVDVFRVRAREERAKASLDFLVWFGDDLSLNVRSDGPLFFFMVRAADLKANYQVKVLKGRDDRHTLQLTPRTPGLRREFTRVLIGLNKSTYLPEVVRMVSLDGNDTKTIKFTRVTANHEMADDRFRPPTPEGRN